MKLLILILLLFISCYQFAVARYTRNETSFRRGRNLGPPLFLTDYLEKGQVAEARQKAWVWHPLFSTFDSYAGLLTVNQAFNSNIYFWFFPSQRNYTSDPVVLWFNNEPATSNLFTIFEHNGPLKLNSSGYLEPREYSLTVNHSVIYMDIIGAGFSFTQDVAGVPKNQDDVARDITLALVQFYQLFPELQENEFFVGGNAYGGQYALSVANLIKKINNNRGAYINLQGVILGNGLIDTMTQMGNAEFLFQVGLVDRKQKEKLKKIQDDNRALTAFTLEKKITGYKYYENFLYYEEPDLNEYSRLVDNLSIRRAIHVGDMEYTAISRTATRFFGHSLYKPLQKQVEGLLSANYRVLVYHGQMDFLFPYAVTQDLYEKLNWPYVAQYKIADRVKWWLGGDLAGYVKTTQNLVEVLLRNAGHVTFVEQPYWTCELITRFTHKSTICQEIKNVAAPHLRSKYIYF